MNDELKNRLRHLRAPLLLEPMAPLIGNIEEGLPEPSSDVPFWDDFLRVCDGARFDSVDVFSDRNLDANQFRAPDIPEIYGYSLIIGQILYQPVFLPIDSLDLMVLQDNGETVDLGAADQAVLKYFLGDSYINLAPSLDLDEWWDFIERT